MDAERIESMLRAGPPGEPRYEPLFQGNRHVAEHVTPMPIVTRPRLAQGHGRLSLAQVAMAVVLVTIVVGGALLVQSSWRDADVGAPTPGWSPSPSSRSVSGVRLEEIIATWVTEVGADAAVGVVLEGRIYAAAAGIHSATGLVRIGPVSKLYLAAVALQLVDEGRLSLDDRLVEYVPDWPNADTVTVGMLLNGSSGVATFGEPIDALERRVAADPGREWSARDALDLARQDPPRFRPGARVAPTDTDDALLAVIIEQVTGATASAEIRRRLLDPFGLRTTFTAGEGVPPAGTPSYGIDGASEMLRGHRAGASPGVFEDVDDLDPDLLAVLGPARGMAATVVDLARWSDLLHREPDVLSDESRALVGLSYDQGGFGGVAWCPCPDGSSRALVIGGPVAAYSALVAWFPGQQMTIAVVTDRVVALSDIRVLVERIDSVVTSAGGP